ncbi:unnamed protein product [Linum tenue]|uniref:Aspartyl-tRNA synthetase n=1 Tax=Linum tenue TaxID=586396 RepID=A0AAV0RZB4_9ROSI|nr:unnamed protein product [Linum tenue]
MSSSEPQNPPPEQGEEEDAKATSKKAAKKEAAKQEKLRRKAEAAALAKAASSLAVEEEDPLAGNYGDVPLNKQQSREELDLSAWTKVRELNAELKDKEILIRGRAQTVRPVSKNMAFVVVRESGFTVQCVVTVQPEIVSRQMVKFISGLTSESIVEVQGIVSVPNVAIKGATQQVLPSLFFPFIIQIFLVMLVVATLQLLGVLGIVKSRNASQPLVLTLNIINVSVENGV